MKIVRLSFYCKSSFGFGVFNSLLTLRRHCMANFVYICLLLRCLINVTQINDHFKLLMTRIDGNNSTENTSKSSNENNNKSSKNEGYVDENINICLTQGEGVHHCKCENENGSEFESGIESSSIGNKRKRHDGDESENKGKNTEDLQNVRSEESKKLQKSEETNDNICEEHFENADSPDCVRDPEDITEDIAELNTDLQTVKQGKKLNGKLPPEACNSNHYVTKLNKKGYFEHFFKKNNSNNEVQEALNETELFIKSELEELDEERKESQDVFTQINNDK